MLNTETTAVQSGRGLIISKRLKPLKRFSGLTWRRVLKLGVNERKVVNGLRSYRTLAFVSLMIAVFGVGLSRQTSALEAPTALQTPPHLTINATQSTAFESGATEAVFVATRDGSTTQPLVVHLNIGGTATNGQDYVNLLNQIEIPAGSSSAAVRVKPIDDQQAEPDETVNIGIADVLVNSTFTNTLASVSIKDNDTVVELSVVSPNGSESGPQPIVFRLSRTGEIRNQLTVSYVVNPSFTSSTGGISPTIGDGSVRTIQDGTSNTVTVGGTINVGGSAVVPASNGIDFSQLPGTLTFQVGETTKQLTIIPIDDSLVESKESITLAVARSQLYTVGPNSIAMAFIDDNDQDLPLVSIVATQANASEEGPTSGLITVTRSVASPQSLTVSFNVNGAGMSAAATNGVDFERIAHDVVIPANATSATITIKPIPDKEVEGDEKVVLQLITATPSTYTFKSPGQATVVIKDLRP